jgi:hypothetical protein
MDPWGLDMMQWVSHVVSDDECSACISGCSHVNLVTFSSDEVVGLTRLINKTHLHGVGPQVKEAAPVGSVHVHNHLMQTHVLPC